jgi:hypothetical protein
MAKTNTTKFEDAFIKLVEEGEVRL